MDGTVGYGGGWISIGSECVFENLTENRAINIGGSSIGTCVPECSGRRKKNSSSVIAIVDIFYGFRFKSVDGNYIIILW